jgi:type IV conjugative transfer system coupling protein TraD
MKKLGPGGYTRGWETVGHYLAMFRASVRTHLFLSLFLGLTVGSAWFYRSESPSSRGALFQYLKAGALAGISAGRPASFDLGDGPVSLASRVAYEHFKEEVFGGRSCGFLARQWAFCVAAWLLLFGLLSFLLVSRFGRGMNKDWVRRGAVAVDVEREKKRARTRATVFRIGLALVLGGALFGFLLGPRGRSVFGDYYWSSLYLSFPPAARLASPDDGARLAWYTTPEPAFRDTEKVHAWIRAEVYGGTSLLGLGFEWIAWSAFAWSVVSLWTRWRSRKQARKSQGICVLVAAVELRPGAECEHFLFTGSPGSGKSTAIKEVLDQVRARGQRAIVFDPSGEYIAPYYREGVDVIMNPLDARGALWTLWAEVRAPTDYTMVARSLFPSGGRDPFWSDAGAALFGALAEKLGVQGEESNRRLHELLTAASIEELGRYLSGTSAAKFLDPSAGAMPSNLIATVTAKVGAWRLLPDPGPRDAPFSVRRFVEDESHDSWMFLAMRQDQEAALKPLVSLWCDLASTAILSLPPDRSRRFWVVLDEVATLQRLPALEPLMAKGRKHGAVVALGLQSMAQLRDSYGRDGAEALAAMPQTWLALRTVEPGTAKWLEQALGEAEVDETRESVSMGADSIRDGVSLAENYRRKPVAMATELMTLPTLEGFLKQSGSREIYRVKLGVRDRPALAPIFLPRTTLGAA